MYDTFIANIQNAVFNDWIYARLQNHLIIIVFFAGCMIRVIPEIVAYPYPIGYDVVNYYIPVITNLEEHWSVVSEQLPIYTLILYSLHSITGLAPPLLVSVAGVLLYGFFSVSIFLTSSKMLRLNRIQSAYLALFVILQLPALRTSWDLHKDILALSLLLTSTSLLIPTAAKIRTFRMICSYFPALVAVSVDKMVGVLLVTSLFVYALAVRVRHFYLLSLIISVIFSVAILSQYGSIEQSFQPSQTSSESNDTNPSSSKNNFYALFALFFVVNGPLLIPGGFGFIRSDSGFLKISTTIAAVGSLSWLVFPDKQSLVADRWIFLFGIFLSVFAGYGVIEYLRERVSARSGTKVLIILLATCVILGTLYGTMPYQFTWTWQSILGQNIEPYGPSTMQFNSIAIKNSVKFTSMISWINDNTPKNALFIGENHWRGWMELELKEERNFMYYDSQESALHLVEHCKLESCYLIARTSDSLEYLNEKVGKKELYQNELLKIYAIREPIERR